jgi:hypothetical protein
LNEINYESKIIDDTLIDVNEKGIIIIKDKTQYVLEFDLVRSLNFKQNANLTGLYTKGEKEGYFDKNKDRLELSKKQSIFIRECLNLPPAVRNFIAVNMMSALTVVSLSNSSKKNKAILLLKELAEIGNRVILTPQYPQMFLNEHIGNDFKKDILFFTKSKKNYYTLLDYAKDTESQYINDLAICVKLKMAEKSNTGVSLTKKQGKRSSELISDEHEKIEELKEMQEKLDFDIN